MVDETKSKTNKEKGLYESYASFSSKLRTWLVAYGIGAPVLFASQEAFKPILSNPRKAMFIIGLLLLGAGIQIFAAFIYKYSMGYIYFGELDEIFQKTKRYKISEKISEAMWLEMLFDIISIGSFIWATLIVLRHYIS